MSPAPNKVLGRDWDLKGAQDPQQGQHQDQSHGHAGMEPGSRAGTRDAVMGMEVALGMQGQHPWKKESGMSRLVFWSSS